VAAAFAPFNVPRAKGFMGDSGSYFLGGWLSLVTVIAMRAGLPPEAALAPLAIYLVDTGSTLVRRAHNHEPIWEAHRSHAYQRLVIAGWSHMTTTAFVAVVVAVSASFGALATADHSAPRVIGDIAVVVVAALYLATPARLERRVEALPTNS
jgi:UDP-N-acetylmuramyl pentapeptide phosphotransferase/UDP-N-acetylglucosamine-1-phosphate transferase